MDPLVLLLFSGIGWQACNTSTSYYLLVNSMYPVNSPKAYPVNSLTFKY